MKSFRLKLFTKEESGAVIIIVAVLMVVLLGMTALAVDVGNLYQVRRDMVNAADAAAMAGVQQFLETTNESEIETYAIGFAVEHYDCDSNLLDAEANNIDYTVWVKTGRNVDYTFGRIFGLTSTDVTAEAKAVIRIINEMEGLRPIHIQESLYNDLVDQDGEAEHDFVQFHQISDTPGNWGWVSFHGQGETAAITVNYLEDGYPIALPVGYEFNSNTGNNVTSGPTGDDVDDILRGFVEDETIFYIPVTYDVEGDRFNGNEDLVIKGFAAIQITDFNIAGPQDVSISGKLVKRELADQPQGAIFGSEFDIKSIFLTDITGGGG